MAHQTALLRAPILRLALARTVTKSTSFNSSDRARVCLCRCFATSSQLSSQSPNHDYIISPIYHNRNPRNLEKMALARKRLGWKLSAPRKDYYHKLMINLSNRHTEGYLEHCSGEKVITTSTREWAIRNQLYSCTDVSASENVGHVLASRCLESGITEMFFDKSEVDLNSDKISRFLQAFTDLGIFLTEPAMIVPEHLSGINYDGFNRYAEPKQWQDDYQKD